MKTVMTTRTSIIVVIAVLVVATGGAFLAQKYWKHSTGTVVDTNTANDANDVIDVNSNDADVTVDYPPLGRQQEATVEANIEQWSLYKNDPSVVLGTGDCGDATRNAQLAKYNAGSKQVQQLNGALPLVITPNIENLTQDQVDEWGGDEKAFCAVAGIYPSMAYPERILWIGTCGSGVAVDSSSPDYPKYVACNQALDAISTYFSQ